MSDPLTTERNYRHQVKFLMFIEVKGLKCLLFKYFTLSIYELFARTQLVIYGLRKDAPIFLNSVKCSVVRCGNENNKCLFMFNVIVLYIQGVS